MRWAEIKIEVPGESVEAVVAALLEIGCQGVSERGEAPRTVTGFLPKSEDISAKIDYLEDQLERLPEFGLSAPVGYDVGDVDEADWANEWKKHFKPLELGNRLVIKPSWEEYNGDPNRVIVEIDPGMAFGTGGHPTTRLCLELLDELVQPGMLVADIGCGSGILALAAARLGARYVHATDIDSLPRKIARENVTLNNLDELIRIHEMDEFDTAAHDCDLVVANILASTVIDLTPSIKARLKPGALFVASGIVEERLPDVLDALEANGFTLIKVETDDIWRATVARL